MWFSANISANNLAVGLFGPLVFGLGCSTAYTRIWGPQSGNRTMVVCRYFMGCWPSKIPCFLNIVLMDWLLHYRRYHRGGQMLVGCERRRPDHRGGDCCGVSLVNWVVAVFGMRLFHEYESFWCSLCSSVCAGPYFDISTPSTGGDDAPTLAANRLTFLSLCLSSSSRSWGSGFSFSLVFLLGIGLATGIPLNTAWADASAVSTGGLIVAMGGHCQQHPGHLLGRAGVCQVLGRHPKAVPWWVWSIVLVLVELLAGREHLFAIFSNFLALMGYWMMMMICIVAQEHLMFRRNKGFDWSRWEDKTYLPLGCAALTSLLLGWLGAVLGMFQLRIVGR
ncbi:hypothetical protein B0T17DRAFT_593520 [Bombardia bombarda]|uniref:Uncharacterized protein n=1 Tax=Bombardia bombarda TaxID=252184 RepID=A0AA39WBM6_9PEZI|nr:hypothetical protein B0T17DRAFT_593520 [Bombardia bombarda]